MSESGWLCLKCRGVTPPADDLTGCSHCGDSKGIPADLARTVTVRITEHELRVLIMWAEFWASAKDDDDHRTMRRVVYGIAGALQAQIPSGAALTFANELADLRAEYGAVEQNVVREDA